MEEKDKNMDEQAANFVTVIHYRGYDVPIYSDDPGQQFYCVLDGEEIGFGSFNIDYQSDLEYLIDQKLDVIHRFDTPYFGAKIEWFDNGGFRDIRLVYRTRVLRIFLCSQNKPAYSALEELIDISTKVLEKVVKFNEEDGYTVDGN